MMLSGFTFIHDALIGGYPIKEAVQAVRPFVDELIVIDMESDDGTRELLQKLDVTIWEGEWGTEADKTLDKQWYRQVDCKGDVIVHFEADEVWDSNLLRASLAAISMGYLDISVYRLQLEQNFQRCKWYPYPVHRIFPKGRHTRLGHTTNCMDTLLITPEFGFLWDVSNCFRDNYRDRILQQAKWWNNDTPHFRYVPYHYMEPNRELESLEAVDKFLASPHWTFSVSPFNLPDSLKALVGKTRYNPNAI